MNKDEKGKLPSPKKLKQFIDRGGYALLESVGEGKTAEEKQMSGWEKHGLISKLKEKTKITRPTLYRIKACFPTLKSTGMPSGFWIKEEDFKRLKDAYSRLKNIDKLLNVVRKYFERSLVIDLQSLRTYQQIHGWSTEDLQRFLKQEVEAGKKEESTIEKLLKDALDELRYAWIDLHSIIISAQI